MVPIPPIFWPSLLTTLPFDVTRPVSWSLLIGMELLQSFGVLRRLPPGLRCKLTLRPVVYFVNLPRASASEATAAATGRGALPRDHHGSLRGAMSPLGIEPPSWQPPPSLASRLPIGCSKNEDERD